MFVSQGKYDSALYALAEYQSAFRKILKKWEKLVTRINDKGGEDFLDRAVLPENLPTQFSDEDLVRLIQLCHPDKHSGKPMAVELTAKLIKMKDKS